ncbi:MAG: hypothetical protein EZS28_014866 [Streblomastix strix]|uniref:Uncharacterized protein n=1 Tax=Streblomastix strix TaxID=222440 RepID=A0A5J4W4R5_9EUKA|nr:MAG: hypothetical protein EZS28_014866 [Streblomastix strix]
MGFFSGIANFGSKILGGVKKAAQWVAPALHKVLSTISGPVSMIHPAIGGALGAGANLAVRQLITNDIAYYIQYQKRGNSSGGMMSNEDAESGTVRMYDQNWYNSGDIVPDQVTLTSDATPLSDGTATAGISTEYSRGDHIHPLNVTTTIPVSDSASGSVGTANYYTRSDHSHPLNITTTIPPQDSASGSVGTTNYYAKNDQSHPINVETNASNIPIVNEVGNNGSSAYYSRHDHVHPQQLTYDGNVTATKFIKIGGLTTEVLCANVDTKAISDIISNYVDLTTNQTITGIKTFNSFKKTNVEFRVRGRSGFGPNLQSCMQEAYALYYGSGSTRTCELWVQLKVWSNTVVIDYTNSGTVTDPITNTLTSSPVDELPTDYTEINSYNEGIRISRSTASNYSGIFLGCNPNSTGGTLTDQWSIVNTPTGELRIGVNIQLGQDNQALMISADGNTLTFNGRVL